MKNETASGLLRGIRLILRLFHPRRARLSEDGHFFPEAVVD